jgi:methionyl aminopeptidase
MDKEFVNGMRKAGKLAARVLAHTVKHAVAGVSTNELDQIASDFTLSNGGTNACLGYGGYPKTICTSVNEVLCHGVPDDRCLRQDDTVNIDVTVKVGPYHGDCSVTIPIGNVLPKAAVVIQAALEARDAGIRAIRPFGKTGDIGFATESLIQKKYPHLWLVKDIGGHGIGKIFHDFPFVPSQGRFGTGDVLKPWSCITVEPIVWENQSYKAVDIEPLFGYDKCKVKMYVCPKGLSAQFEHTVLVTDTGYEILTVE